MCLLFCCNTFGAVDFVGCGSSGRGGVAASAVADASNPSNAVCWCLYCV